MRVTFSSPINIALIKYWGKVDPDLNLPSNSSLSVTISQSSICTTTSVCVNEKFQRDRFWLNGKEVELTDRMIKIIYILRSISVNKNFIYICSVNNFPTAAGLASSASGMACWIFATVKLLDLKISNDMLSSIVRQGSGSACRSLYGGFVEWHKGTNSDTSISTQFASHWPELKILILITGTSAKKVSSTVAMQRTSSTSNLYKQRMECVHQSMNKIKKCINEKEIQGLLEVTMRDSNQFHAVCMDTFPPVMYLNDVSREIIECCHDLNRNQVIVGYTFDAGPNAVLLCLEQNLESVIHGIAKRIGVRKFNQSPFSALINENGLIKEMIITCMDSNGPVPSDAHLLDESGNLK